MYTWAIAIVVSRATPRAFVAAEGLGCCCGALFRSVGWHFMVSRVGEDVSYDNIFVVFLQGVVLRHVCWCFVRVEGRLSLMSPGTIPGV